MGCGFLCKTIFIPSYISLCRSIYSQRSVSALWLRASPHRYPQLPSARSLRLCHPALCHSPLGLSFLSLPSRRVQKDRENRTRDDRWITTIGRFFPTRRITFSGKKWSERKTKIGLVSDSAAHYPARSRSHRGASGGGWAQYAAYAPTRRWFLDSEARQTGASFSSIPKACMVRRRRQPSKRKRCGLSLSEFFLSTADLDQASSGPARRQIPLPESQTLYQR